MNPTLYQQLSPLGFAEWLIKEKNRLNSTLLDNVYQVLQDEDLLKEIIKNGDIRGTMLNALAFRWLREEKKLECNVSELTSSKYRCSIWHNKRFVYSCESFHSWEEAEHHALCKALEILSKGGENG